MASLQHEYIMKFYGAVILGSYADSVGLVLTEFIPFCCRPLQISYNVLIKDRQSSRNQLLRL